MASWWSSVTGLADEEEQEQDPVSKTLASLGQGLSSSSSAVTGGIEAVGTAASEAGSTARGWLDDAIQGVPTLSQALAAPGGGSPVGGGPRPLAPGETGMLEQLPAVGAEYVRAAGETLGDRGAMLAGMRPPETPQDVMAAAAPAPYRLGQIASEVGGEALSAGLGEFAERAGGSEPTFRTNELQTPFGTIPSLEGPTPRQVGETVGRVAGDPFTWVLPGSRADKAADLAIRNLGGAVSAPVRHAVGALGEAISGNAGRVAAADARMAAEGGTSLPATFGALPEPSAGGPAGRTVEVLREQLDTATSAWQRAREAGDERMAALAREHAVSLESDLSDALNARRSLEPAITSDVGRRVESLPLAEETADTLSGAGSRRADIEGLGGPVSHIPSSINLNAGLGGLPEGGGRRWVPDARYQSGGFWWEPKARVPEELRSAEREYIMRNADLQGARQVRQMLESRLSRAADDVELQHDVMTAITREEEAKNVADAAREWVQMVKTGDKTLVTAGMAPEATTRGAGALSAVNRALGEGIAGGVGGAVIEQGRNPDEDPRSAAARGFAAGAVGFPVATRLARGAARLAGAGQDLGGGARIALGDVPPSQIHTPGLPGFEPTAPKDLGAFADEVLGPGGAALPVSGARAAGGQTYLPSAEPGPVGRLRQSLEPWWNRAGIVRYAGMLSDTAGHVQNLAGNLAAQLADLVETPLMVAQDVARVGAARAIGRPAQREVFLSEVPARIKGMAAGARAGLGRAREIMTTGTDPEQASKLDQGPRGFGTDIPGVAPKGSRAAGLVDVAFEGPLRALGAADAVFRGAAASGHLAAESLAEATKRNGGKAPTAEQIKLAMADAGVRDRADDLAARSVLQEDRKLTTWYRDQVVGKAPIEAKTLIQTVIPWVRTPYNIIAQGLGMTDVGALAGVINDVRKGTAPRAVQRRLARAAIGTAIGTWAAGEYADGTITGPYPSDTAERSTLPPGWRPWSRKVEAPNGETYYLPLAALGPFAVPAVYQILRAEAIKKGADPFSKELLGDVAMGIGRYAEQNTFLEGLGAISKVFDERSGDANIERLLEQTVSSYAPHVLGFGGFGRSLQRAMGMTARDPENAWEAALATSPLTAGYVRPRQDVLGREESMGIGGPAAFLARGGVENDDPVIAAFRAAGQALPSKGPSSLTDPGTKQAVTLDADQKAQWEQAFGQAVQTRWAGMGYPSSARSLNEVKQKAAEDARRAVLGR